jgi:hypothetical protein
MFNHIRYAAHVLAYSAPKPDPYNHPDIVFVEQKEPEVSRVSRFIANFIGILTIGLAFGSLSAFFWKVLPLHPSNSAVAVGVLAVIMAQLWAFIHRKMQAHLDQTLRVGERIAPFLGHKITKAIDTLRS